MKKITILILLSFATMLWAEIGSIDGAGLNLNMNSTMFNDKDDTNEYSASQFNLNLAPSAHFFIDDITEFIPYLSFGWQLNNNPDNIYHSGYPSISDESHRFYLGAGASLLWHFLETWRIDLLTGFRGDIRYGFKEYGINAPTGESGDPTSIQLDTHIYIPLAMDFILTRDFTLRISSDIIKMGYSYEKLTDEDETESSGVIESSFPLLDDGDVAISVSAIYYFGD